MMKSRIASVIADPPMSAICKVSEVCPIGEGRKLPVNSGCTFDPQVISSATLPSLSHIEGDIRQHVADNYETVP